MRATNIFCWTRTIMLGKCTDMGDRLLIDGKRLASLRTERFLTQEELAEQLGMSTAGVRRLEQVGIGGIQFRNFRRLAEMAQLTPHELRRRIGATLAVVTPSPGAPGQEWSGGRTRRRHQMRETSSSILPRGTGGGGKNAGGSGPSQQIRTLPVMEIERFHGVSAARPEAREGVGRGRVPVPASSSRRFAAVVDGDCMEPKFRNGDVVVFSIDAAEREGIVEGRNYFLQFIDGENTFKRIFFDPDNVEQLVLRCWNAQYPHRSIRRDRIQLLARAEFRLLPDEAEGEQGNA